MKLFRTLSVQLALVVVLVLGALLAACDSRQPSNRELGVLGGAALGAGLGAIVGHQSGHAGEGVAIGAAAGALAGGLIGNAQDNEDGRLEQQEEILRRQDAELERQRRELEDLRRQRYHDDSFDRYDNRNDPPRDPYDRGGYDDRRY